MKLKFGIRVTFSITYSTSAWEVLYHIRMNVFYFIRTSISLELGDPATQPPSHPADCGWPPTRRLKIRIWWPPVGGETPNRRSWGHRRLGVDPSAGGRMGIGRLGSKDGRLTGCLTNIRYKHTFGNRIFIFLDMYLLVARRN